MSVHSEQLGVTLNGNIITRHNLNLNSLLVMASNYEQLSVVRTGGTDQNPLFDISSPMDIVDHKVFAGLIHRQNSENKLGKSITNPDDKPDGTPPSGGTPGALKQELFEHVQAIAA